MFRNSHRTLTIAVLFTLCCIPAFSGTIFVKLDSPNDGPGNDWEHAFHTVQAGIDAAAAGDEVWVCRGRYIGCISLTPGVRLYGGFAGVETERNQRDWSSNQTSLDGNSSGPIVRPGAGATSSTVIDGFTIANGSSGMAGGIYCATSSPTISHNRLISNGSRALYCDWGASPVISGNLIIGNHSGLGCDSGSAPVITNNIIADNRGPGLSISSSCPVVTNNTIVRNGVAGLSLSSASCALKVSNNIVAFNQLGIACSSGVLPVLRNNDVYGKAEGNYSGVSPGVGDISGDPMFVSTDYGNFRVRSGSACTDAGWNDAPALEPVDFDGDARVENDTVDIGADEYGGSDPGPGPYVILRVSPDGDDGNDGLSWTSPKRTIQSAIWAASALGGEVWVRKGVYPERLSLSPYAYVYAGFAGAETSRGDRDWRTNGCIIDGQSSGSVVKVTTGTACSLIDGFMITNGRATTGGGILCQYKCSPFIRNNRIVNNSGQGGGIACLEGATPTIDSNEIRGNSGSSGGGIYCSSSSPTIVNNVIAGNTATSSGGGGIMASSCAPLITNNTLMGNSAINGGALCFSSSASIVSNNIVVYNSSGINAYGTSMPTLRNNDFYLDGSSRYRNISPGIGDISLDPMLVGNDYGGFHIQSGSPCINAGWNAAPGMGQTDIDGDARIIDEAVDIGADEYDGTEHPAGPCAVIRVAPDGDDSNSGLDWLSPKKTISSALAAASLCGGEVWVKSGVYSECIVLPSYVYLYGGFAGNEPTREARDCQANKSTIDGGGAGSVVTCITGYNCSAIDGFTIRNGYAGLGGGLYCVCASPAVTHNSFESNIAGQKGGGAYFSSSYASVMFNSFSGNDGPMGGAIYTDSFLYIISNRISSNRGNTSGGGIYSASSAVIAGNIIDHNITIGSGGGISNYSYGIQATGNTIVANIAGKGGGIYTSANTSPALSNNIIAFNTTGLCGANHLPVCRNNDVYGNSVYNYSGLTPGEGDISLDPLFVNRAIGDYHLTSASPCINAGWNDAAGVPDLDLDGEPRINGVVDIGADEYWSPRGILDTKIDQAATSADLDGVVVTAAFPDFFYVQIENRTCGLRVNLPGHSITQGMRVHVSGEPGVTGDSERCINASTAHQCDAPNDTGTISPLALSNSFIGGGPFGAQQGVWGWRLQIDAQGKFQKTWGPVGGLNTIGLLVKTWGRIVKPTGSYFSLDDGSDLGIKVVLPDGVTLDPSWTFVTVTGVCSCEKVGEELRPVVLVRSVADLEGI